ncbi:MAG: hypothetical protein LBJ64_11600 [Deltaproteobacteria bacterium]|nr:hypothetical protein [Deltaproteobacteria bacterium]
MTNKHKLKPGQVLVIPGKAANSKNVTQTAANRKKPSNSTSKPKN